MGWVYYIEPHLSTGSTCCCHIPTSGTPSSRASTYPTRVTHTAKAHSPCNQICFPLPNTIADERPTLSCIFEGWMTTHNHLEPAAQSDCRTAKGETLTKGLWQIAGCENALHSCFSSTWMPREVAFAYHQHWFTQRTINRLVFRWTLWDSVPLFPGASPGFPSVWNPSC